MTQLDELNDDELARRARKIHETLMKLPRNHASRDSYIVSYRQVIDEMNRRSLPRDLEPRQPGSSGFAPGSS